VDWLFLAPILLYLQVVARTGWPEPEQTRINNQATLQ
jgi:hypothetical protein